MKNWKIRGAIYLGLFTVGLMLFVFGLVRIEDLGDVLVTAALAATAAGNLLARTFLSRPDPEPRGIDPLGPNA